MLRVQKCFLFLCAVLCSDKLCAAQRLGYEYIPDAGGWLRLHIAPANWHDALMRCNLEGGILASPSSSAIASAMKTKMAAKQQTAKVYIGIHAALSEEEFVSLDGVPFANISVTWAPGEPDNRDNREQCLTMTDAGEVADIACYSVFRYFCFKEDHVQIEQQPTNSNQATKCGTSDEDYKFDPRTGSCYKFHLSQRSWCAAEMACLAAHAHLAVINSDVEAEVLKELFEKYPDNDTVNDGLGNTALVGFLYSHEEKEWKTMYNETLAEAGFEGWAVGEPNNVGGVEYCGSILRDGLLNDISCDVKSAFICELTSQNYC